MSMFENNSYEKGSISQLFNTKQRKKNDYVKLEEGAYPRMFLQQLIKTAKALATDNLGDTRMVKLDDRSGRYLISMGFGKRNTWFRNELIAKGTVREYRTAEEALKAIQALIKYAAAGAFNDALEDLRKKRQEHAATMIEARDVCGFHRRETNGSSPGPEAGL